MPDLRNLQSIRFIGMQPIEGSMTQDMGRSWLSSIRSSASRLSRNLNGRRPPSPSEEGESSRTVPPSLFIPILILNLSILSCPSSLQEAPLGAKACAIFQQHSSGCSSSRLSVKNSRIAEILRRRLDSKRPSICPGEVFLSAKSSPEREMCG